MPAKFGGKQVTWLMRYRQKSYLHNEDGALRIRCYFINSLVYDGGSK